MARYEPCRGWKQAPQHVYKPVRRWLLYNGKEHRDAGQGLCPSCQRVTSVLDDRAGQNYIGRHSPKRQSHDERRKKHWEAYDRLNPKPRLNGGLYVQSQWTGYMPSQSITMSNNAYIGAGTAGTTLYTPLSAGTTLHMEVTSDTRNAAGQYLFNINGQQVVSMDRRITIATDHVVWNNWANTMTVSTNTTAGVWNNWTAGNLYRPVEYRPLGRQPVRRPAYDQVARAEDLFRRVDLDTQRLARAEAGLRARETLMGLLSEEQQEEYEERQQFHVTGSNGTLYRIKYGTSGNIRRVRSREDEGREEAAFCVHSTSHTRPELADEVGIVSGHLPHEDHMIQQMLHLMINEDEILAQANVHWGSREPAHDYEVLGSGLLVAQ